MIWTIIFCLAVLVLFLFALYLVGRWLVRHNQRKHAGSVPTTFAKDRLTL